MIGKIQNLTPEANCGSLSFIGWNSNMQYNLNSIGCSRTAIYNDVRETNDYKDHPWPEQLRKSMARMAICIYRGSWKILKTDCCWDLKRNSAKIWTYHWRVHHKKTVSESLPFLGRDSWKKSYSFLKNIDILKYSLPKGIQTRVQQIDWMYWGRMSQCSTCPALLVGSM